MTYVADIMVKGDHLSMYYGSNPVEFVLRDTECGFERVTTDRHVSALGVAENGLVKYDKMSASLFKHIEYVGYQSVSVGVADSRDCFVIGDGLNLADRYVCESSTEVFIEDFGAIIKFFGARGSIIQIRTGRMFELWTMSKFISEISKICGVPLTKYNNIHICKHNQDNDILIQLSQSPEAKRFYTKMLFDMNVVRR